MKRECMLLISMMRQKWGNWHETQNFIGNEIMSKFENSGYISRIGNEWHINPEKRLQALRTMFDN